jgi:dolichyl-phosphate beta-glucosyltransferase
MILNKIVPQLYLSLVIPAYKEATRIGPTLKTIYDYLGKAEYQSEVIVVDDGSPDDTKAVIEKTFAEIPPSEKLSFRLIEYGVNKGKGAAVQAGMLAATGDVCIFTDADLSTPIYEIEKVFAGITEGFDVVIGSRALEGRKLVKVHQPWYREAMGRFFNLLVQIFVIRGIRDTQCGFKGFRNEVAKKLFNEQKVMGFSFDVDILFLARKHGYKIKEVAVEWYNDERTTVGALSDSAKMFLQLLKIRGLHK